MSPQIPLTPELTQAIAQSAGGPVYFTDAQNGQEFVVLPAEDYENLAAELTIEQTYPAQNDALSVIWNDPELDVYNDPPPAEA
jgi:hypothetical protein